MIIYSFRRTRMPPSSRLTTICRSLARQHVVRGMSVLAKWRWHATFAVAANIAALGYAIWGCANSIPQVWVLFLAFPFVGLYTGAAGVKFGSPLPILGGVLIVAGSLCLFVFGFGVFTATGIALIVATRVDRIDRHRAVDHRDCAGRASVCAGPSDHLGLIISTRVDQHDSGMWLRDGARRSTAARARTPGRRPMTPRCRRVRQPRSACSPLPRRRCRRRARHPSRAVVRDSHGASVNPSRGQRSRRHAASQNIHS
jgi:hypothetical protein